MTADERIARLEKWLRELYATAEKDMRGKWDEHLVRQEKRAEKLLSRITEAKTAEAKAEAEAKYKDFLKNRVFAEKYYKDMVEEMARQYADAGRRAAEIVNGERFGAFADGYNFSAGEINRAAIAQDVGIRFDLCDAGTIEHLAEHAEDLMLPKADPSKVDLTVWNVHNINSQVTQGIVQGESIPKIAARLGNVTHMNEVAAARTARTMVTASQNAGRIQSMQMAEDLGVKTRKQWVCTHDSRTRHSHLMLDGETVANDAEFSNKCRYPGDPNGPAKEVYNCRCTLVTVIDGFSSNLPKGKENAVHVKIDGEWVKGGPDVEHVEHYTHEEHLKAIRLWANTEEYKSIRSNSEVASHWVDVLEDYISQSPPVTQNLYRGIAVPEDVLHSLSVGETIDMRGISSWSVRKGIAQSFMRNSKDELHPTQVFFILDGGSENAAKLPTKAAGGGKFDEGEVLVSGHIRFKIISIKREASLSGPAYYIKLKEVK